MIRFLVVLSMVVATTLGAPALHAQEPMGEPGAPDDPTELTDQRAAELDAQSAEIAARLRCPVCSGQSVLESNAPISQEMQQLVRERLERGETEEEIIAYFRSSYGDWIILQPRPTGWNLLVYVLPVVVLVAGGAWLFVVLRRWSRRPAEGPPPGHDHAAESDGLSDDDEDWLQRSIGGV